MPALRQQLCHCQRSMRPVPDPHECQRRIAQSRIRPPHLRPYRSDRKKTVLSFSAGFGRFFAGHGRMSAQMQILSELGNFSVIPGGFQGGFYTAGKAHVRRAYKPLAGDRLHLQRTDGFHRISDRHRAQCPATGYPLRHDQLRFHERGAAR
ncbi:MAG: hypothetical protein BWX55_00938 [Deltaproteobacteria bacterium ADurb.Bin022]|nr:MAG: hypothetical protein BWX55_00938 [Deltaproteobacteria bacterium ADurb.Bin022]